MKYFLLLIILLFQSTHAFQVELTKEEKEYIKKNPTITLGGGESFEPFLIRNDNGSISGYDVDIVKLIAQKTGLKIKFELGNWSEIQKLAIERKLDGISTSTITEERKKYYNASKGYYTYVPLIIVNKGNPKALNTIEDLKGKKVAIQRDNAEFIKQAQKIEKLTIVYYDSMHDVIRAVINKEVDFTIIDETAFYVARILSLESMIEHSFTIGEPSNFYFNLRSDHPLLVSIINKGLVSITHEEYSQIKKKWFSNTPIQTKSIFTSKEKAYLQAKKEITLCTDPDWMPFSKLDKNKYIGINADIYKLISQKLNIPITPIQTKNWEQSLEYGKNRKCDIFDIAISTPSRKKYLNFTSSFIDIPLVIVTDLKQSFIYNFDTLKGKKVAITKGYAFIELLRNKYPFLNIVEVDSISQGLELLSKKDVFGYIGALPTIANVLKKEYLDELKIAGRFDETYSMGSAVRNDDLVLFSILEKVINTIHKEEINHIVNKWIDIKIEKEIDFKLFFKILSILAVILLFIFYRHYRLNKIVNEEIAKSRKKDNLIFQQNKMASLGEMIGNIAHQWRQPLAQISMIQNYTLSKLEEKKDIDKDIVDELRNAQVLLKMISNTIDSFQSIYQGAEVEEIEFYPSNEIDKVLLAVEQAVYLESIKIELDIDKSLSLYGSSNFFLQVILSITQNSIYFLRTRDIQAPKINITIYKENKQLIVTIEDNAKGVDKDFLPFIFDYGFSRKENNTSSTGIGLYIAKLITIEKFDGSIEAKNTSDGLSIKLSLPLYNQKKG